MKVLIIEDENHSAERLQRYIRTLHPDYEISGITKSIVQSIDFLQREQAGSDILRHPPTGWIKFRHFPPNKDSLAHHFHHCL